MESLPDPHVQLRKLARELRWTRRLVAVLVVVDVALACVWLGWT
jgi:hypothetical protein